MSISPIAPPAHAPVHAPGPSPMAQILKDALRDGLDDAGDVIEPVLATAIQTGIIFLGNLAATQLAPLTSPLGPVTVLAINASATASANNIATPLAHESVEISKACSNHCSGKVIDKIDEVAQNALNG